MLRKDGISIVGKTMIPEMFALGQARNFEIMHKRHEVGLESVSKTKKSFQEFIKETPFKEAEFIEEGQTYFWALRKQ